MQITMNKEELKKIIKEAVEEERTSLWGRDGSMKWKVEYSKESKKFIENRICRVGGV